MLSDGSFLEARGEVTRDDVAAVLATLITEPRLDRTVLYLGGVDVPIEHAVTCSENAGAGR